MTMTHFQRERREVFAEAALFVPAALVGLTGWLAASAGLLWVFGAFPKGPDLMGLAAVLWTFAQ